MTPDARPVGSVGSVGSAEDGASAEVVWGDVLRDYRQAIVEQRCVLGRVHDDSDLEGFGAAVFTPPAGLPPLPAALIDEAVALDAETTELLVAARALLAQMKPPNTMPVHRSILNPPSPSQMDTRL